MKDLTLLFFQLLKKAVLKTAFFIYQKYFKNQIFKIALQQNKKYLFTSGITHPLGLGPDIDSGICSWCQIVNAILFGKPNS